MLVRLLTLINVCMFAFCALSLQARQDTSKVTSGVLSKPPPPQVAISPAKISLNMDETLNGSVRIYNLGEKTVFVNTQIHNFDLDRENRVRIIPSTEKSLNRMILINPVHFSIEPKGEQVVRFSIRPSIHLPDGEHRAIIFFQQRKIYPKPNVHINFRLGVPIYAQKGKIVQKFAFHGAQLVRDENQYVIAMDIENLGNSLVRVSGNYRVQSLGSSLDRISTSKGLNGRGNLPATAVFPENRRKIKLHFTAPEIPGEYFIKIDGRIGIDPLSFSIPFSIE